MVNTIDTGYAVAFAVDEPVISVKTNTAGTEIVFQVDTPNGASIVLMYRLYGTIDWTETDPVNTPVAGTEITISGLTADATYEVYPVACAESDGHGARSNPGSLIQITTIDTTSILAPDGTFMGAMNRLKTLLANSATFQTWVGANNAEEAKASIFLAGSDESEIPEDETTGKLNAAFAFIVDDNGYNSESVTGGSSYGYIDSGVLRLTIAAPVPSGYMYDSSVSAAANAIRRRNAAIWFMNRYGKIRDEMKLLAGGNGYLTARSFTQAEGPYRTGYGKKSQGDIWEVTDLVRWGI